MLLGPEEKRAQSWPGCRGALSLEPQQLAAHALFEFGFLPSACSSGFDLLMFVLSPGSSKLPLPCSLIPMGPQSVGHDTPAGGEDSADRQSG